jgi:hypothetical protein
LVNAELPVADISIRLNNILVLLVLLLVHRDQVRRWCNQLRASWRVHGPRRWQPQSPRDCAQCRSGVKREVMCAAREVAPYAACKSRRGRRKTVPTRHFACPNVACCYHGITDDTVHALVGHGKDNGIQRLKCQACGSVFTSRIGTPLYYLKADRKQVELVLGSWPKGWMPRCWCATPVGWMRRWRAGWSGWARTARAGTTTCFVNWR